MKNAENIRSLLYAMSRFCTAYKSLKSEMDTLRRVDDKTLKDLINFANRYPFDIPFDELPIEEWFIAVKDQVRRKAFKVLKYEYFNSGGNTMVGSFEVWIPALMRTMYVLVNEEGYTMAFCDYIQHDLDIDDYDEVIFDCGEWDRLVGNEDYFELYRHCLNEYTKSDCDHFSSTAYIPFNLLSEELMSQLTGHYVGWMDEVGYTKYCTDGRNILLHPLYEKPAEADDWRNTKEIKKFRDWHDTTAGDEQYYPYNYKLELAGKSVELPFIADVWEAVDSLLGVALEDE